MARWRETPGPLGNWFEERRRARQQVPLAWNSPAKLESQWIGHSTVLLRMGGLTILTDPILSQRCGLNIGRLNIGPKRLTAPALQHRQLPQVDLILLSHAHMDHFDLPTLRRLESQHTAVVTASRTADLLRTVRYQKVTELGWGDETRLGPLTVKAFRVRHWGARMRTDTFRGYNAYLLEADGVRVVFGGDTAMTDSFREVRTSKHVDLAIMPIGAYDPWIRNHCTPEQAWRMAHDAGAEHVLPVHHQTFRLSREPFYEPIERLMVCAGSHPDRVPVRAVGDRWALH
jgi:L-ascorbate metabolism protein UlaG (beta-lactamase superfamily)